MTYVILVLALVAAYMYRDRLFSSPGGSPAAPAAPSHPLHDMLGQAMDHFKAITIETANAEAERVRRTVLSATLASQVASIAGGFAPAAPASPAPPAESPGPK